MRDDAPIKQARHSLVEINSGLLSRVIKSRSFLMPVGIIGLIMIIVAGFAVFRGLDNSGHDVIIDLPHSLSQQMHTGGILTVYYPDGWVADTNLLSLITFSLDESDVSGRQVEGIINIGRGFEDVLSESPINTDLLNIVDVSNSGEIQPVLTKEFIVNDRIGMFMYHALSDEEIGNSEGVFFAVDLGNVIVAGYLSSNQGGIREYEDVLIAMAGAFEYEDSSAVDLFDLNSPETLNAFDSRATDIEMTNAQVTTYIARTEASELGTNETATPSAPDNS